MIERAASSTAVLVCQGRVTADARYAVDRFHDPVARELLDPGELVVVDDLRAGRAPTSGAERMPYELVRWTGVSMVPRMIAIDDAIRAHAAPQMVILGAGLDSRAWRMPELASAAVFEADHPASSRDRARRVPHRRPGRPAVRTGEPADRLLPGQVLAQRRGTGGDAGGVPAGTAARPDGRGTVALDVATGADAWALGGPRFLDHL